MVQFAKIPLPKIKKMEEEEKEEFINNTGAHQWRHIEALWLQRII